MMLIGLPSTLPPKSSIAICPAGTEPWPVGVEAGPFMSVSTPILTTSSEIWASAEGEGNAAAAKAASTNIFLTEITGVLPFPFGALAILLTGSVTQPVHAFAINSLAPSTEVRRQIGFDLMAPGRNR